MDHIGVADNRDLAICGHGAAGKTTLLDALLFRTGAVSHQGRVDDGSSLLDFDVEEKQHKYTIESKAVHFDHQGKRFFCIDTPGYPDFIGQTIGALNGVDTAAIVINAHSGIEANTRRVFEEAGKLGLGRLLIVNKFDHEHVDVERLIADIQETFGHECLPMNLPIGSGAQFRGVVDLLAPPAENNGSTMDVRQHAQSFLESLIEMDEEITARYFEGEQPTAEELKKLVVEGVRTGHVIPILFASGRTGVGIPELLDALALCTLPPGAIDRTATASDGSETHIVPDPNGPLVAQVFKTRIDPFVQKLSFLKIHSGTLHKDQTVHVSGERKSVKVSQLLVVQADKTEAVDEAFPGEIVAIPKIEELHNGRTIGDLEMPSIRYPEPMVGKAVTPKSRNDEGKLSVALSKIIEEDPTAHLDRDAQTKELVLTGMSELHLQILQERLHRRDKVDVETHDPKIPYRETIQSPAEGSYRHKKQSGGRGQFGEVHIRLFPFPRDVSAEDFATKQRFPHLRAMHYDDKHHFLWIDSIVGGTIPNNFLPAVEKGFKERIERGVIAGYQIQNVAVEVYYGKHHPVDSSEAAFKTAGSMAFRNVFREARPCLLEPIVKLHVTVPLAHVGDINSDLAGRRGRPLGMDAVGSNLQTIHAEVPLSEIMTYARALSSLTGGQGSFTIEPSHYETVPPHVQKQITEAAQLAEEEE